MSDGIGVAVVGVGETRYETRPDANYIELVQQAAAGALEMAGMTAADVDAGVFSMAPTAFCGLTNVEKSAVSALGLAGKPFMRVHTGGATGNSAAQAGYAHVASGLADVVLVVGGDKVSETPDAQSILNLIWDPFFERPFALNTVTMAALQAHRYMHKYDVTERDFALVAQRSWRNAMDNPNAHLKGEISIDDVLESAYLSWPLKRYDCCPRSSGAAAALLVSERVAAERSLPGAWVVGVGSCANTVFIGDRMGEAADTEYGEWDELKLAADQAYEQAGITDPASQVDVLEIYAPFTVNELQGVEALGLCPPGEAGARGAEGFFDRDGEIAVNPSGGTLCANPIGATGLVRFCDSALQILDRAGDYQVPGPNVAVATAPGGSFQFQACTVLSREPRIKE